MKYLCMPGTECLLRKCMWEQCKIVWQLLPRCCTRIRSHCIMYGKATEGTYDRYSLKYPISFVASGLISQKCRVLLNWGFLCGLLCIQGEDFFLKLKAKFFTVMSASFIFVHFNPFFPLLTPAFSFSFLPIIHTFKSL